MQLNIVKIGGNVLENRSLRNIFLKDFASLEGRKILVHGGGKEATSMAKKLHHPVQLINGRRRTDKATLDIITMLYAGKINKQLVAQLQALRCNALGLSGADAGLILARKRSPKPLDYGWVGDIEAINVNTLNALLNTVKVIPVFCALTHDKNGQLLNTNADSIAATLATALQPYFEVNLTYCLEKNGVYSNLSDLSSQLQTLNYNTFQRLKNEGAIHEGMLPKLDNAFYALQKGVAQVTIGGPNTLQPMAKKTKLI